MSREKESTKTVKGRGRFKWGFKWGEESTRKAKGCVRRERRKVHGRGRDAYAGRGEEESTRKVKVADTVSVARESTWRERQGRGWKGSGTRRGTARTVRGQEGRGERKAPSVRGGGHTKRKGNHCTPLRVRRGDLKGVRKGVCVSRGLKVRTRLRMRKERIKIAYA